MKKTTEPSQAGASNRDTLRSEYDFSGAARGATAARYAQGTNVVVVDPDVLDVFPDASAVNEVLRALAPLLRQKRKPSRRGPGAEPAPPADAAASRR